MNPDHGRVALSPLPQPELNSGLKTYLAQILRHQDRQLGLGVVCLRIQTNKQRVQTPCKPLPHSKGLVGVLLSLQDRVFPG